MTFLATIQSPEPNAPEVSAFAAPRSDSPSSFFQRLVDVRRIVASQSGAVRVSFAGMGGFDQRDHAGSANHLARLRSLTHAQARCEVERLRFQDHVDRQTNVELAVEKWLAPGHTLDARVWSSAEVEPLLEVARARAIERQFRRELVRRQDGATLSAYSCGSRNSPPLVLVIPCGMPLELSRGWLEQLGQSHFVVTWESRGMFDLGEDFDKLEYGLSAQTADVFAVMDHYGIGCASVMALCVGAVSALSAAAQCPDRVESLVFGNGFFSLPDCAKTETERNLLLAASRAAISRPMAARMHEMFMDPNLFSDLDRSAHCTFYPYATPELLHRYGKLCSALHSADKLACIGAISQPILVITGLSDTVVHPDGSRVLAHLVRRATLQCELGDDHLDVFEAGPKYVDAVRRFLATTAE